MNPDLYPFGKTAKSHHIFPPALSFLFPRLTPRYTTTSYFAQLPVSCHLPWKARLAAPQGLAEGATAFSAAFVAADRLPPVKRY